MTKEEKKALVEEIVLTPAEVRAAYAKSQPKAPVVRAAGRNKIARHTIMDYRLRIFQDCKTLKTLVDKLGGLAADSLALMQQLGPDQQISVAVNPHAYDNKLTVVAVGPETDALFEERVRLAEEKDTASREQALFVAKSKKFKIQQDTLEKARAYKKWLDDNNIDMAAL